MIRKKPLAPHAGYRTVCVNLSPLPSPLPIPRVYAYAQSLRLHQPLPRRWVQGESVCLSVTNMTGSGRACHQICSKKDVMVIKDALLNVGKCSAVFNFFKIKLFSLTSIKKTTFHPCLFIGFLFSHSDNLYRV